MIEQLMISLLTVCISLIGTLIVIKFQFGHGRILEYCDIILDNVTQDTEMQKKVYIMGVLLGNGIKSGIGLPKGGGKFKMQDLIGMALPQLFPKLFKGQQSEQQSGKPMDKLDWQNLNK